MKIKGKTPEELCSEITAGKFLDGFTEQSAEHFDPLLAEAQRRFDSLCAHEQTRDGRCVRCLRVVIIKHKGSAE